MKRSLGAGEWIRRGAGRGGPGRRRRDRARPRHRRAHAAVARQHVGPRAGAGRQACGKSPARTGHGRRPEHDDDGEAAGRRHAVARCRRRLSLARRRVDWLNSPPLTPEGLRGKVVLVDFWTYSCINCLRTLPYVRAWAEKYKDQGLVVIGVHTPEFAFEKQHRQRASAPCAISGSTIRSRSTTTSPSGAPSTTSTGRRTTSSMRRAASAITISAKASTTSPSA